MATQIKRADGKGIIVDADIAERIESEARNLYSGGKAKGDYTLIRPYGEKSPIPLHRWIMDAPEGSVVYHINHDVYDNRRKNLRVTTQQMNTFLRKGPDRNGTTGYRGVYALKDTGRFFAKVVFKGKQHWVGTFDTAEQAAEAAEAKRQELLIYAERNEA